MSEREDALLLQAISNAIRRTVDPNYFDGDEYDPYLDGCAKSAIAVVLPAALVRKIFERNPPGESAEL